MKKLIYSLVIVLTLTACTSSPNTVPSPGAVTGEQDDQVSEESGAGQFNNFATAGPKGIQEVRVSEGVILVTPGQATYPTPVIALSTETAEDVEPAIDPTTIEMPEGIPVYDGVTGIQSPDLNDTSGADTQYVSFYSTDPGEQILSFYMAKAAEAGWTLFTSDPGATEAGKYSAMWTKDSLMLNINVYPPKNGQCWVYITWMNL